MRLLLPDPHPDELLISVVARHQAHLGSDRWDGSLRRLLDRRHPFGVDAPDNLDVLGRVAGDRFAPSTVIAEMTLVPFYVAYHPRERVDAVMTAMTTGGDGNASKTFSFAKSRLARPPRLRFCRSCRDDDLASLGETYWRRTHQLACVLACPDHEEALVETHEPLRRQSSRRTLPDATHTTDRASGKPERAFPHDPDVVVRLATKGRRLLRGDYGDWPRDKVRLGYVAAFADRGYGLGARQVDAERVASEMADFFGRDLLDAVGAALDISRNSSWLRVALRPKLASLTTVEHVLVQTFLDSRPAVSRAVHVWDGPWRCNNPHAGHDAPTIESVTTAKTAKGGRSFMARCPCGQAFSFKATRDGEPDAPVVTRNNAVAPSWRREVLRLAAGGLAKQAIARSEGLSEYLVEKIIADGPEWEEERSTEEASRRARWEALLASVPGRSRELARKADPNLFATLHRMDRTWLLSAPRRGPRTTVGRVVDWERADEITLGRIQAAVVEMCRDPGGPRVTLASLAEHSGQSYFWLHAAMREDKLPRVAQAVSAAVETLGRYHERKARARARSLVAAGERPSVARLRRVAALEDRKYGSAQYKAIYERVLAEVEYDDPG